MIVKRGKGQAALEFLVTYGWAILAAMLAIAALAYFGTSPKSTLPDKCIFNNNFACTEYIVTANKIQMKMVNGQGQTVYAPQAGIDAGTSCTIDSGDWASDDIREINCSNPTGSPFTVKDKVRFKFNLNYTRKPGGYLQLAQGELYTTVQ
jgi:hypothetical protein